MILNECQVGEFFYQLWHVETKSTRHNQMLFIDIYSFHLTLNFKNNEQHTGTT